MVHILPALFMRATASNWLSWTIPRAVDLPLEVIAPAMVTVIYVGDACIGDYWSDIGVLR